MRAAIWFLLPSDGMFIRDFSSLHYYLACQGRRVILRGGEVTGQPWENKLNWIPDSAPSKSRNHGFVNSALCPGTEKREQTRTKNQENEAPLSDSADPSANWMQDPRSDQCKGKLPSGKPLRKTRCYATRPRDEEGYTPGARKNCLYETLIGHTGSHTQEPIKLIMQLIADPLPYPAAQQPAHPPGTRIPLAGLISRPGEAGSSNSTSDLVENTSPRYRSNLKLVEALSPSSHSSLKIVEALSPSYCSNLEHIEIQSLSHYTSLNIKEVLFPSLQTTATRCLITSSHSHAQLVLTSSSK